MDKYFSINENRCSIRCRIQCSSEAAIDRIVLCCHGFAGSKDSGSARKLAEKIVPSCKTTAVVSFDWPCHGDDRSPRLDLPTCDLYLRTVISYLRERFGAVPIFVNAVSFGGYLVLKYISDNGNPFEKIVLRSPAVPMYQVLSGTIMTEDDLAALAKTKPVMIGFDVKVRVTAQFLQELKDVDLFKRSFRSFADDILILHGTEDEIVPYSSVCAFAEQNGLLLLPSEGADHRYMNPEKFCKAVNDAAAFYGLR